MRVELAKAYRDRGYHDIALEISRLAVARFPESGAAQLSLVRDLRDANQRAEAITGLEAFLKQHPESAAEYYSWLGILRDESGLWPLGEPAHRKAIELAPSTDYLHNNLGYNLLMQKKDEEAAAEFRAALKLNPGSAMARNNLGIALAHSNAHRTGGRQPAGHLRPRDGAQQPGGGLDRKRELSRGAEGTGCGARL